MHDDGRDGRGGGETGPPAVAERLLGWLLPVSLREPVLGDLREGWRVRRRARGGLHAWLWYWGEVLRSRPLALRRAAAGAEGSGASEGRRERRLGVAERWLDQLGRDGRVGLRALRRAPGFAAAAVLTLGLGTGAATAVFSLVQGVVLRPLPFAEPDRLAMLWETNLERGLEKDAVSPVNFMDFRSLDRVVEDAAAWWRPEFNLSDGAGEPLRVGAIEVSENFFDVLGVAPMLGPGFPRDSTLHGGVSEVVISHRLWRTRFAEDPSVLGQTVHLNGVPFTIVGVMPPDFEYPKNTDVWQRLYWDLSGHSRFAHFMEAIVRLRPGVTLERANAELAALGERLGAEYPQSNEGWSARLVPLAEEVTGVFRPALLALLGAAVLLLGIACLNVANLLLARASARNTEVAVRAALGASRGRLVWQLLVESLILGVMGTVIGLVTAVAGVRAFLAWSPIEIPRADEVAVNGVVLAFAAGIALATTLGFGLAPALVMTRTRLRDALREDTRADATGSGGRKLRSALVMAEVAMAVVLLAGAGLLVRSVSRMLQVDVGVRTESVVTANLELPSGPYPTFPEVAQFYARLMESVREQPGVLAAGASNTLPLQGGWRVPFLYPGSPTTPDAIPMAQYHTVDEGWFAALGVELVSGRVFDARDDTTRGAVVVVNEALVKRYFPGEDVVGRRITIQARAIGPLGERIVSSAEPEIAGVVADVRNASLADPSEPAIYFPQRQFPFRNLHLFVRGAAEASSLLATLRREVHRLDPSLPLAGERTLERVLAAPADPPRLVMTVLSAFAVLALTLAAIGIYGIISYVVNSRKREIGIRMALGAQPREVLLMVLRQGLLLGVAGAVVGLGLALLAGRLLSSLLFGIEPTDPATLTVVFAAALAVAMVACFIPGRRAAATQPMRALRAD